MRAINPWSIIWTTELPRAILQCIFFTVLGASAAHGTGSQFTYVGSLAMILLLYTVVEINDVPSEEKWQGTFFRLRLSQVGVLRIFGLRAVSSVLEASIAFVMCWALVGLVTGNLPTTLALIPALPIYLVIALTTSALGLATASLALGRRSDVVIVNGLVYLIIATGGVVVPLGSFPALDAVGSLFPLQYGLLAARAMLDGHPWGWLLAREVVTGVVWAIVAAALFTAQVRRARRTGTDDFA